MAPGTWGFAHPRFYRAFLSRPFRPCVNAIVKFFAGFWFLTIQIDGEHSAHRSRRNADQSIRPPSPSLFDYRGVFGSVLKSMLSERPFVFRVARKYWP